MTTCEEAPRVVGSWAASHGRAADGAAAPLCTLRRAGRLEATGQRKAALEALCERRAVEVLADEDQPVDALLAGRPRLGELPFEDLQHTQIKITVRTRAIVRRVQRRGVP